MATIGSKLRTLRKARRMTQQQLAEGISSASLISQIESGRVPPSPHIIAALSERLQVDPDYFADDLARRDQAQLYRRAKSLMGQDRYLEAADILAELVQSPPPQVKLAILYGDLANCYSRAGRLEEATETYETLVDLTLSAGDISTAIHSLFQLGHLLRQLHSLERARMYWQRASELLRRNPHLDMPVAMRIHANLGRIGLSDGHFEQAKGHYEEAIRLAKRYSSTLDLAVVTHGLANVAVAQGAYDQALKLTAEAERIYSECGHSRGANQCKVNRVYIHRQMHAFEHALADAELEYDSYSFRQDPLRLANLYMEAALCHAKLEQWSDAFARADNAIALIKPDSERSLQLQVQAIGMLMEAKRYDDAIERIERMNTGSRTPSPVSSRQLAAWLCQAYMAKHDDMEVLETGMKWLNLWTNEVHSPSRLVADSVSFPVQ